MRQIQFQALTIAPPQPGVDVLESERHQPWSEPVRFKILPALTTALAASGCVIVLLGTNQPGPANAAPWLYPWSEPVRIKPAVRIGDQPFFSFQPNPVVSFSYYNWLTEPVRLPNGLKANLQVSFTESTLEVPIPALLLQGWYNWLEEPVRLPIGLKSWLQQTAAYHPRLLPNPSVTAVMSATEVNSDVALFGGIIYTSVTPAAGTSGANVSIKEIPAIDGAGVSIEG